VTEPKIKARGITLSSDEATALAAGNVSALLRRARAVTEIYDGKPWAGCVGWHRIDNHGIVVDCPFATVGGVLWGQEQWCSVAGKIRYRADHSSEAQASLRWHSPHTLPRAAARWHRRVSAITPVNIMTMTENQVRAALGPDGIAPIVKHDCRFYWLIALDPSGSEASQ
jgi:hypothetical protein